MRIQKKLSQHRRDFQAIFECEHCGHTVTKSGYDDEYFHTQVIPKMPCPKCAKIAPEDFKPQTPVYPDGMQV